MIPFGNEAVTLVQRVESVANGRTQVVYRRQLLTGCSWRHNASWKRSGETMARGEEIVCRIPAGQAVPKPGDCLFRGDVLADNLDGVDLYAALETHRATGAFRVASVSDNAAGAPLPHCAARGSIA